MKIIDCKYSFTGSLYRSVKIVWFIELNDNRVIEFHEWQDWEGSRVEEYGILGLDSWPETEDILDPVIDLIEKDDFTGYTECKLEDLLDEDELSILNHE